MFRLIFAICIFMGSIAAAAGSDDKRLGDPNKRVELEPKFKAELERGLKEANRLSKAGENEAALELCKNLAQLLLDNYGPYQLETLEAQVNIGGILEELGRFDEVEALTKRWLKIAATVKPAPKEVMLHLTCLRGNAAESREDWRAAASAFQLGYQLATETLGPDDWHTWAYGTELARCHYHLGNIWMCEILARPLLDQFRECKDSHEHYLEGALSLTAYCQYARGDFDSAADLFRELVQIRQRRRGESDYYTLDALAYYANCFDSLGRDTFAQEIHARWVALTRKNIQKNGEPPTSRQLWSLGAHLLNAGEFEQAEILLGKCMKAAEADQNRDLIVSTTRFLIICKNRVGKPEEGERLAREYLSTMGEEESTARRTSVKIELAKSLAAQGKREEAIGLRDELAADPNLDPYFFIHLTVNGEQVLRQSIPALGTNAFLLRIKHQYEELCSQIDAPQNVAAAPDKDSVTEKTGEASTGEASEVTARWPSGFSPLGGSNSSGYSSRYFGNGYEQLSRKAGPRKE